MARKNLEYDKYPQIRIFPPCLRDYGKYRFNRKKGIFGSLPTPTPNPKGGAGVTYRERYFSHSLDPRDVVLSSIECFSLDSDSFERYF